MTLADIEAMDRNTLTVKQVAEFLGKDPKAIRDQANTEPRFLGFPICKAMRGYCIPREGFIAWVKGQTPLIVTDRSLYMEALAEAQKRTNGGGTLSVPG